MAQIGFLAKPQEQDLQEQRLQEINEINLYENQLNQRNRLQIIVVAGIGLFALVVLIIAQNYIVTSTATVAIISQFRDFVSGSVGISCRTFYTSN